MTQVRLIDHRESLSIHFWKGVQSLLDKNRRMCFFVAIKETFPCFSQCLKGINTFFRLFMCDDSGNVRNHQEVHMLIVFCYTKLI